MNVFHNHHIIPKHMGGTNDPSNLIKLTIQEHAAWHYELWVYYGKQEDWVAWKSLSSQIGEEERLYLLSSLGGQKGAKSKSPAFYNRQKQNANALWNKPGMREFLSKKRIEQNLNGKNPMQGKQQKRVCCLLCKKETGVNVLPRHYIKCVNVLKIEGN